MSNTIIYKILYLSLSVIHCLACTNKVPYIVKVFTSEKGLKKHKFENHYLIDNAYDCDECGKRFESQVKLKVHTRSHKIKNCELCNVVVTEKNYTRHKKEKHLVIDQNSNPQEFKCGICGQAFTRKEKLESHSKSCGSILKDKYLEK